MNQFTTWLSFADCEVTATVTHYAPAEFCPYGLAWEDSSPDEPAEIEVTLTNAQGLNLDKLATKADWERITDEALDYMEKERYELQP